MQLVWQPPQTALVTLKPQNLMIMILSCGMNFAQADVVYEINCDEDNVEDGCEEDLETRP